jgi:uncharacterized membrane protein
MGIILLSYFSTMVTVLTLTMVLLNGVLGASTFHARAHPKVASAQIVAHRNEVAAAAKRQQVAQILSVAHQDLAGSSPANGRESQLAAQPATQPAFEQKALPVRVARDQRREERIAARRPDQGYPSALGYAPESREQLAAARIFGPIGQLR